MRSYIPVRNGLSLSRSLKATWCQTPNDGTVFGGVLLTGSSVELSYPHQVGYSVIPTKSVSQLPPPSRLVSPTRPSTETPVDCPPQPWLPKSYRSGCTVSHRTSDGPVTPLIQCTELWVVRSDRTRALVPSEYFLSFRYVYGKSRSQTCPCFSWGGERQLVSFRVPVGTEPRPLCLNLKTTILTFIVPVHLRPLCYSELPVLVRRSASDWGKYASKSCPFWLVTALYGSPPTEFPSPAQYSFPYSYWKTWTSLRYRDLISLLLYLYLNSFT